MRISAFWAVLLVCLLGFLATDGSAAPFDPLFRVDNVQGDCSIQVAGGGSFGPMESGKAYPYGSELLIAPGGSVTVLLSDGNTIAVQGPASLGLFEDPGNRKTKVLRHHSGKIDVSLEENYAEANSLELLTRCTAITYVTGGASSVDVKREDDLNVVLVLSQDGDMTVKGPHYELPLLSEDDAVSIACSDDRGFIRIRDVAGKFTITVRGENDSPRIIEAVVDTVVKILQKPSVTEDVVIVTILEISPDGEVVAAETFTTGPTMFEDDLAGASAGQPSPTPAPGATSSWPPLVTTTTILDDGTTTTTSIPLGYTTTITLPTFLSTTTTRRRTTTTTMSPGPTKPKPTTTTQPDPTPTGRR